MLLAGCSAPLRVPFPGLPSNTPKVADSSLPMLNEEAFDDKPLRAYRIPTPKPGTVHVQTVIGEMSTHRVRQGETLLDVARYYDLGINEIADANPGVDLWTPKVGSTVVVRTYPVGLGRDDRRTPKGAFSVTGKTVNPTWVIPPRIRQDHIREKGDARSSIPGGAADNPLGKYRFELSLEPYRIHGTNIPWGIGMLVSNGCARLYPEDVEHLFPMVKVGTKGAFIYQPVKVGVRGGQVYVEAHADLYRQGGGMPANAAQTLEAAGLEPSDARVAAVLKEAQGVPKRVGGVEPPRAAKL